MHSKSVSKPKSKESHQILSGGGGSLCIMQVSIDTNIVDNILFLLVYYLPSQRLKAD